MSYNNDPRNKYGKILSLLILKSGVPLIKSGTISMKTDMSDDGLVEILTYENGVRKEIHTRKINVIFTPNGKFPYHQELIKALIINKIIDALNLMGLTLNNFSSLINLFMNIDGNIVKWRNNYPSAFYVPDEMKIQILKCLESKYRTGASYTNSKGNVLKYDLDFDNMELNESEDSYNAGLYLDFAIKNITINDKSIPFRRMRESQLLTSIGEDVREGEDFQIDAENCAYPILAESMDFTLSNDIYLNVYTYLKEVDGNNVSNADDYAEQSLDDIMNVLAKEEY